MEKPEFTPLELDRLLGKKQLAPRHIKVHLQNAQSPSELDEEGFRNAFQVEYTPCLRFASYDSFKETLHHCPWIIRYTWIGKENRTLGHLYREQLSQGYVCDSLIKWIDPVMGYGLFTEKDLHPGDYIGEYTGLVRRLYRTHPDHNAYCFHYPTRLWSREYTAIDALIMGNELRYLNHSDTPNLRPACLYDRGLLHLAFFANQHIAKGSELLYNYGEDFWLRRKKA